MSKLITQDIIRTNVLAKIHFPLPGGHVYQPTGTIFKFFHEERTSNVACRVFTRKNARPLAAILCNIPKPSSSQDIIRTNWTINMTFREKCPTPDRHCFQQTGTIFELVLDIIEKNLLTKFHEYRTKHHPRCGQRWLSCENKGDII
ncbi:hypothetical protein DPMN_032080 [Dreissena polymorpha]|uniref:Uncharacterized protein n=1 Tax=Dreissena polymorpha TaxID=45954 RepID=A0A9D4M3A3_DREPO|nr:hypothetical protein DPMN_032080 [Dreissena polymorpha]